MSEHPLQDMSIEQLEDLHRQGRERIKAIRKDLDAIERVLAPKQAERSASRKLASKGLSKAEIRAFVKANAPAAKAKAQ